MKQITDDQILKPFKGAQITVRQATLEKSVDWLNIVNRLYGSVREVKIYEKPQGKLIINDEDNGVLMVISNTANKT